MTEAVPQKSPHGYVVGGNPGRFGGFIGDCTSDENFPHYWECQAENAGEWLQKLTALLAKLEGWESWKAVKDARHSTSKKLNQLNEPI